MYFVNLPSCKFGKVLIYKMFAREEKSNLEHYIDKIRTNVVIHI